MIDGVIKYELRHTLKEAPSFAGFAILEPLRARLFALGLIGEKDGIGYGNLSMRHEESQQFFITATQTGKQAHLSLAHYSLISDYDVPLFRVCYQGIHQPSSEALSHAMIYAVHPEIQAVIHIHSAVLWQFMKDQNWLATTAEYGTAAMATEISQLYQTNDPFLHNAFVMKGHEDGIMVFARTALEAELRLYELMQDFLQSL
ncbi:MAG: class II aldolase/adducin family protein [Mariprofundaceae bacterium]|nr:class II aldolase/adducin family protein [Mariprofundaceae bacterium]